MSSFDIVSKVDDHELTNSVDQANREIQNRFDFKGSNAKFELANKTITFIAPNDFQLKQMDDILRNKLAKRDIDAQALEHKNPEISLHEARQIVTVRHGIDKETAKKIVKIIKNTKLKVQASIQEEQVRVSGKKRDDLQEVITLLRDSKLELPLQFENFRD